LLGEMRLGNLSEINNVIEAEILRPGPFWFDNLSPLLANQCWAKLHAIHGIGKSNYGTSRILEGSPAADRVVLGHLSWPGSENQIVVEELGPEIISRYQTLGLEFYPSNVGSNLLTSLNTAIRTISSVQGAAVAASSVLSVIHILKPETPEYDVSYSEPPLPFSIFVGVPMREHANDDLRLAESILHECMHLQLTLIEDSVALFKAEENFHQSPWKQMLRPTRGVIHGLYVFRVIQDFLCALNSSIGLSSTGRSHIVQRLREIDDEVHQLGDLSGSPDLTRVGKALVERLQIGNR
jgi:hypothetical protein